MTENKELERIAREHATNLIHRLMDDGINQLSESDLHEMFKRGFRLAERRLQHPHKSLDPKELSDRAAAITKVLSMPLTFNEQCEGCGKTFSEVNYESKEQLRVAMMISGWIELPKLNDQTRCFCPNCISNPKSTKSE